MQYQILKEPMAILEMQMSSGEKITAESGSMVYMKGDIEIKTRTANARSASRGLHLATSYASKSSRAAAL